MSSPATAAAAPLVELTGYDDYDDPKAVEAFRAKLRKLRMARETGMLHVEVRIEAGHRRHMPMTFIERVEGSSSRSRSEGLLPPGVTERRRE